MRATRARALALAFAGVAVMAGAGCGDAADPGLPVQNGPPVSPNEPGPGDPPVVWLAGTLEAVEEAHLDIREGAAGTGPRIRLERLAEGATSFLRVEGDAWRELPPDEVALVQVGERACVETLLDGETFLALRVFLGSTCGPSPLR